MPSRRASPRLSADGSDSFHAQFCRGAVQGIAAASEDAERANSLCIYMRILDEEVDGATDVIQSLSGHFHQPRLAATLALVRSVVRERDKTLFG
jgi:hypothetical protein